MEFSLARPYIGASEITQDHALVLYGMPFDSTTSYRPGSRFAPQAIREASYGLETYDPALDLDLEEDITFSDLGDLELPFGDGERMVNLTLQALNGRFPQGCRPFGMGGEHLCSLAPIRYLLAQYPDLCVVQFDAHADLRKDYLGVPYSHATVMNLALEALGKDSLFQVGIRSGTRDEWQAMRDEKRHFPCETEAMNAILQRIGERPVYLTVDLDVLDPSVLPGTGTPEPGGASFRDVVACIQALRPMNLVGADVVELAPGLDASGVSSIVAAKLIRSILLLFS